jgi:hypothetical protein
VESAEAVPVGREVDCEAVRRPARGLRDAVEGLGQADRVTAGGGLGPEAVLEAVDLLRLGADIGEPPTIG